MARRNRRSQRDDFSPSLPPVLRSYNNYSVRAYDRVVTSLQDRRFFHPDDPFSDVSSLVKSARFVIGGDNVNKGKSSGQRSSANPFRSYFQFAAPRDVTVCVRRRVRREVLFAKRRTGKGAKSYRRRNYWSSVHC